MIITINQEGSILIEVLTLWEAQKRVDLSKLQGSQFVNAKKDVLKALG